MQRPATAPVTGLSDAGPPRVVPPGTRTSGGAVRIEAIQTGTVSIHEKQRAGTGTGLGRLVDMLRDDRWTPPLPIHCWVVAHPEGVLLVDTGHTARISTPGYHPRWHPYHRFAIRLRVTPDEEVGPQLHALGIDPGDVRWVVLTHLHADHVGGLHHMRGCEILVAREEHRRARGFSGRLRGYLPHRWPDWFEPRLVDFSDGPVGPFDRSHALAREPEIRLVPTPGHTAGHLSVLAREPEQWLMFAGDASYTQDLMLQQRLDGLCPLGGGEEVAGGTLERILRFARSHRTVYLPSHDPGAGERLRARTPVFSETG